MANERRRQKAGQYGYERQPCPINLTSSEDVLGTDEFVGHDPTKSGIANLIGWSVKNQLLVIVGTIALLVAGLVSSAKNVA